MKKKATVRHSPRHLLDKFGTNCNIWAHGLSVTVQNFWRYLDVPVTNFDPTSTNLKFQSEQQFKMKKSGLSFRLHIAYCVLEQQS